MTSTPTDPPRIYVASLADYNAGRLHGRWIDLEGLDADDIQTAVQEMLSRSPERSICQWCGIKITDQGTHESEPTSKSPHAPLPGNPEEWAIHDYEGFGGLRLSEWESFQHVAELAKAIEEHGAGPVAGYIDHTGEWDEEGFEESFEGRWDSEKAFAEHLVEDVGWAGLCPVPEEVLSYLDFDKITRDLFISDFFSVDAGAPDYGVYVYRRY